jgi:hypothetical protein
VGSSANLFSTGVNLDNLRILWEELRVGKVAAKDDEHLCMLHGRIARGEAQQSGHAHVKRIVELDMLFAAQGMRNWCMKGLRERNEFRMRAGTPGARKDRDTAGAVQYLRRSFQSLARRCDLRVVLQQAYRSRLPGAVLRRNVAGQNDYCDAALCNGGAHRDRKYPLQLPGFRDHSAIVAAILEQLLWMGFLEVGRSELCTRNLRGYCQHRDPTALTVEETIDEVQIAWSTATGTHRKLPLT